MDRRREVTGVGIDAAEGATRRGRGSGVATNQRRHQREGEDLLQGHVAPPRQRVAGAAGEMDLVRFEGLQAQSALVGIPDVGDSDVELSGEHLLDDLQRARRDDLNTQPRVSRHQAHDGRRHRGLARVGTGSNDEIPGFEAGEELQLTPQLGFATEQRLSLPEQEAPVRRRLHPRSGAIEELHAQFPLQDRDTARETRLGEVESIRRPREIARPPERERMLDEPELDHDAPDVSEPSTKCIRPARIGNG